MAILPFKRSASADDIVIEAPQDQAPTGATPASQVRIETDDDGVITLAFGSPEKKKPKLSNEGFGRNLAEDLSDGARQALAAYLMEEIENDIERRRVWTDTVDTASDYLGIDLVDPVSSVAADGTICQAVATCLLEVAIKAWGTGCAELLPTDGPVKTTRMDTPVPVPTGGIAPNAPVPAGGLPEQPEPEQAPTTMSDEAGDDLADALEKDMNWYLTTSDRGYYPDFAKMLMNRNLIGMAFREVFRCPIERKPISRWIMAQDFIVAGSPAHLDAVGLRTTVRKKVRRSVMKRMQKTGHYLDVELVRPTGISTTTELIIGETEGVAAASSLPRDYEHTVYECNTELGFSDDLQGDFDLLDLDENGRDPGFPLPYRIAIDEDSREVLGIYRAWRQGDPDYRRRKRYVKYGYIPAYGGGFYDWGLLQLCANPTQGATMLQRSGIDAGVLANFPAWMIAAGAGSRLDNTVFRPGPGEVIKAPTTSGMKLSDALMPFPYKEPSAQSMALSAKLEGDVKAIGGIAEIPVGEGRIGNTPVGTIMSYIESISMVPGAVHKQDHTAQAEEFEMLRELLADEPECIWRGNRSPARRWQAAEELLSPDISPRADPNTPSQIHRLLKVQGLIMLGGLPQFQGVADNRAIFKRATEVLSGQDAAQFTMPEPPPSAPPPDPRVQAAQIKAESVHEQGQMKLQETAAETAGRMQQARQVSADKAADREAANNRELMKAAGARAKAGDDSAAQGADHAHAASQAAIDRSHDAGQAAADRTHDVGLAAMDHAAKTSQQLTEPQPPPPMGSETP